MPLITVTSTDTDLVLLSPSSTLTQDLTTITTSLKTTLVVAQGQTVTISSSQILPPTTVTVAYTPTAASIVTSTVTELAVYLEDPSGSIWTTFTVEAQPSSPETGGPVAPSVHHDCGWDCWSQAQKAGLIAGVVLFVLLALGLLCCLRCRTRYWVDSASGITAQTTTGQASGHPGWGWVR